MNSMFQSVRTPQFRLPRAGRPGRRFRKASSSLRPNARNKISWRLEMRPSRTTSKSPVPTIAAGPIRPKSRRPNPPFARRCGAANDKSRSPAALLQVVGKCTSQNEQVERLPRRSFQAVVLKTAIGTMEPPGALTPLRRRLLLDPAKVAQILGRAGPGYAAPDADATMHRSLTFWWWGAEFIPKPHWNWQKRKERRRPNLSRRRTIPSGAQVHQSAFDRRGGYSARLPADAVAEPY
jgi:hypothetical protein